MTWLDRYKRAVTGGTNLVVRYQLTLNRSAIVSCFDHARDVRMAQQRALNFHRRNPPPAGLETIVAATHVKPIAIAIAAIEVSSVHPAVDESFSSRFRLF